MLLFLPSHGYCDNLLAKGATLFRFFVARAVQLFSLAYDDLMHLSGLIKDLKFSLQGVDLGSFFSGRR